MRQVLFFAFVAAVVAIYPVHAEIQWHTPAAIAPPTGYNSIPEINLPDYVAEAIDFAPEEGKPLIAIVIDDMGVDRRRTQEALEAFPSEVTLAYLPYASDIAEQVQAARAAGHEITVHMPMQPQRDTIYPGPNVLHGDLDEAELRRRIDVNLAAFDGYAGLNNHMGSKFTQDARGIDILMREVRKRGLYFLDSRTISNSVAEQTAAAYGVPVTHRDVFLDDKETEAFTRDALLKVERTARRKGSAVAIGHPKDITTRMLAAWIPTLEEKGFQLAPMSAVLKHRRKVSSPRVAAARVIGICEVH